MATQARHQEGLAEYMWITENTPQSPMAPMRCVDIQYRDIEFDGPSTSAEAAQRQRQATLPPVLPSPPPSALPSPPPPALPANTKTLREMLSTKDRIVRICFDDVFTNSTTSYSREKDMMVGCDFNRKHKATEPHQNVVAFAARTLFTPFNIVLNAYPRTSDTGGLENLLEENIKAAEDMGLNVKAIVCDRYPENRIILRDKFDSGAYQRKRADGTISSLYSLHDYPHFITSILDEYRRYWVYADLERTVGAALKLLAVSEQYSGREFEGGNSK
uniref:Transposable element P transposase-like RNase H domain-containing protein n=1 Tax=Glossina morsitans morsitans TaxID=37546 RepID=A0A1B0G3S1_GLOMM